MYLINIINFKHNISLLISILLEKNTLLLSLLLPFYIVISIRKLTNISCFTITKVLLTKLIVSIPVNIDIDINFNILRERSKFFLSNNLRDLFIFSKASSILYYQKMEIQSNNLLLSEQVETEERVLSYDSNVKEDNIPAKQTTDNNSKIEA